MAEPVIQNLEIQHGKPVIPGKRVPVEVIIGSLAGGMSFDEVIAEYSVTLDDIRNCLAYATTILQAEQAYPLSDAS